MDKISLKKALEGKDTRIRIEDLEKSIEFLKQFGYEPKNILGVGAFGAVIEAKHIVSNETDAIKLIYSPDQNSINDCIQEASFMAQMNSPHIVKFIDNFFDPDNSIFYIVFQFCANGDLNNFIKNNPELSQLQIIQLFKGILYGIIDIQKEKVLHGDIKPQNVVINAEGFCLLTDFGLSKQLVEDQSQISMKGKTLAYAPKEQEEGGKLVPQSDYFSAGLILFLMCRPNTTNLEMIVMKYGNLPSNLEQSENYHLIQIALQMMKVESKERMNPEEALFLLEQIEEMINIEQEQSKIIKNLPLRSFFPASNCIDVILIKEVYSKEILESVKNVPLDSSLSTDFKLYDNGFYEGKVIQDKRQGEGIFYFNNGNRFEGKYRDDEAYGQGKLYFPDGCRLECEFKNGAANGDGKLFMPEGGLLQCEYKNGRANGKGKLYLDNGNFLECEYINGEATGQGIYQYEDGDRLECEYKNNRPNGLGKLFKSNGDKLECEFKNGQAFGQGKYYYRGGDKLECFFKNGGANGFGKCYYADGDRLECEYKNGAANGQGILFFSDGSRLECEYKNGLPNGSGKLFYENGDYLECEYKNGQKNGKGNLKYTNGDRLECEYKNGQAYGPGINYFSSGDKLECEYKNGYASGLGKLFYANGNYLECEYKNSVANGQGTLFLANGDFLQCEYKNGKPNGSGTLFFANGNRLECDYKDGQKIGKGKVFLPNDQIFECEYINGEPKGQGTLYDAKGNIIQQGLWIDGDFFV